MKYITEIVARIAPVAAEEEDSEEMQWTRRHMRGNEIVKKKNYRPNIII